MFEIRLNFVIPNDIEELKKYLKNNDKILHYSSHKRTFGENTVFYLVYYKKLKTILYSFKENGLLDYVKFGMHNEYTLEDIESFKLKDYEESTGCILNTGKLYWYSDIEKEE